LVIVSSRDDERVADKFGGLFHCLPLKSVAKSILVLALHTYQRNREDARHLSSAQPSCRDAERAQAAPMLIARVSVSVPQVDVRTLGIVVYITSQVGFVE
jgi:hypothetical protein